MTVFFWGAILAAAANYVAADKASDKQARNNSAEAAKNRDFQADMSGTAYQRAADDMEAAGLNRILAVGSPASTPSGSSASMDAPPLGDAVKSGIAAASAKQQIAQSQAEEALLRERRNESLQNQNLLQEQANREMTQAQLNRATTRLNSARATKEERYNPVHDVVGDVLQSGADYVRTGAKSDVRDAFNFLKNSAKQGHENFKKEGKRYLDAADKYIDSIKSKYRRN